MDNLDPGPGMPGCSPWEWDGMERNGRMQNKLNRPISVFDAPVDFGRLSRRLLMSQRPRGHWSMRREARACGDADDTRISSKDPTRSFMQFWHFHCTYFS
jgi:hypothetical protein